MPLVNFDTTDYHAWYYSTDPATGAALTYERRAQDLFLIYGSGDPPALMNALNISKTAKVALIGGGYGFLAEMVIANGWTNTICVDTSPYIAANASLNAKIPITNADFRASAGQKAIKQAGNVSGANKFDWVITEDMITCFTDTEIAAFLPYLRQIGTNVAHLVSVPAFPVNPDVNDARLNWKTLADWKTLVTPDMVVHRGAYIAI